MIGTARNPQFILFRRAKHTKVVIVLAVLTYKQPPVERISQVRSELIWFNTYQNTGLIMGNVGGARNYGYGKQLAWAGKNALADRYGQGHFSTRATHEDRWNKFAQYLKTQGINDARKIDKSTVLEYAGQLSQLVSSGDVRVAYAQNILSTMNVVLETMRKDSVLTIKPAQYVGERTNVRSEAPRTDDRNEFQKPIKDLHARNEAHVAITAQLARDFGLRFKEASMLDANKALKQANRLNRVNITQGTKGGRGKGQDRWVPINSQNLETLKQAKVLQGKDKNLIPSSKTYVQWRDHAYYQWRIANQNANTEIKGFHDMRAAFACERYQEITGYPAPVITRQRQAPKAIDTQARLILSQVLGHNRIDVIAAYVGSSQ